MKNVSQEQAELQQEIGEIKYRLQQLEQKLEHIHSDTTLANKPERPAWQSFLLAFIVVLLVMVIGAGLLIFLKLL
jgi:hypothetical protein